MCRWYLRELEAQRSHVPIRIGMQHPDFAVLTVSWELALRADGYADNTVKAYQKAVRSLAGWLAEHHPEVGPAELARQHIRGWVVEVRQRHSSNTAGIRTPAPRRSRDAGPGGCRPAGPARHLRRDRLHGPPGHGHHAVPDGGLRLSELAGLQVADVDLRDRIVFVAGKASRRSGPPHRAVPLGVKAARALDRYLRERRRHPYADTLRLWLGSRGRPTLDADGVKAMLRRRGVDAGIPDLHPQAFRHTWAHAFRAAGGNEGDLMLLGAGAAGPCWIATARRRLPIEPLTPTAACR